MDSLFLIYQLIQDQPVECMIHHCGQLTNKQPSTDTDCRIVHRQTSNPVDETPVIKSKHYCTMWGGKILRLFCGVSLSFRFHLRLTGWSSGCLVVVYRLNRFQKRASFACHQTGGFRQTVLEREREGGQLSGQLPRKEISANSTMSG